MHWAFANFLRNNNEIVHAEESYQKAASLGCGESSNRLGYIYRFGAASSIIKDHAKSIHHYRQSILNGSDRGPLNFFHLGAVLN